MTAPRILVAGTHSGAGKTTIATGIMAALHARGLRTQGFKVGPDFIDPSFHTRATGRAGRNLDGWLCSRETNLALASSASQDADAVVIEGVMGMFDGADATSLAGTSAEIALWLDAAVVLVVDAPAMAGSVAAVVHGFDTLLPDLRIAAVIANRVAGEHHADLLQDAIAARCRPPLIGCLPQDKRLTLPERHLGLHLAEEVLSPERLADLAAAIERHVDLDRLLTIAQRPPLSPVPPPKPLPVRARIGVARDAAFCFYYEDNLDLLRLAGAELIEFSPVSDAGLPPGLDGLYLGGGYPELHARALSENASMRTAVRDFSASGKPVYGECGGFMYLCDAIADCEQRRWPMAGVFATTSHMQPRLAKLGYAEIEVQDSGGWLPAGLRARGHEFRYSNVDPMPDGVVRPFTGTEHAYRTGATLGTYVHLHFASCPEFADRFVARCAAVRGVR